MTKLSILLLTTGVNPAIGGPFESVSGLARGFSKDPFTNVTVVGCASRNVDWESHRERWGAASLSVHQGSRFKRLAKARRYLMDRIARDSIEIVHASGLWDETTLLARWVIGRSTLPLVWSIRGMLEPWALAYRRPRKVVAWAALQRASLTAANVIHATADSEARSCRRAGLRQPIAVVPNGIDVHPLPIAADDRHSNRLGRCGYLGRLHPKKGLPNLIEAWRHCDTRRWELVIAGPDSGGHAALLKSLARHHGLANVHIVEPVYGEDRTRFLEQCDLFVCPSFSENFGNAIAEAMERGKPVITTTGTPWSVLSHEHIGWWVDPEPSALARGLADALQADPHQLNVMGSRCREHVVNTYSWPVVVRQMRAVYEWLLGGDAPGWLYLGERAARFERQA
ncbi:MAG: glycosyltransferase [Planctomycetaceae bacterium]|jgi:glycosyltransferase involved in cell wall biosynthesis|nr:glycosyltransferase [Planctomycetaceae bacterium]